MFYTDTKDKGTVHTNGSIAFRSPFPFASLSKIKNCPVSGTTIRRTASITGHPDTFFSCPARIKYKEKMISGFVSCNEDGYYFVAYQYGKNYSTLNCKD